MDSLAATLGLITTPVPVESTTPSFFESCLTALSGYIAKLYSMLTYFFGNDSKDSDTDNSGKNPIDVKTKEEKDSTSLDQPIKLSTSLDQPVKLSTSANQPCIDKNGKNVLDKYGNKIYCHIYEDGKKSYCYVDIISNHPQLHISRELIECPHHYHLKDSRDLIICPQSNYYDYDNL
jgi:hypothetical protein